MTTAPATGRCLVLAPHAGGIDDIGREDDQSGHDGSGYERDETDTSFRQLVQELVDDGDARARSAGRRGRRTLAEMMPGYQRQPVLRLTRPLPMRGAEEACGVCNNWTCTCPPWIPPADVHRAARNPEYACGTCSGWHSGPWPQAVALASAKALVR
ncbi:hypothetical protein [Streptomyces sp. NPDC008125]|uniref:hypothetical protein n=1 Tax=Streptomyces sp. NPDC008125 TaxID=3364811 RepID=UPI0036E51D89